jgi:hypothetical protein
MKSSRSPLANGSAKDKLKYLLSIPSWHVSDGEKVVEIQEKKLLIRKRELVFTESENKMRSSRNPPLRILRSLE